MYMRTLFGQLNRSLTRLTMVVAGLVMVLLPLGRVWALSGSDFNNTNIISDAVFTNTATMSVNDIQNFLNAKMPNCDTSGTTSKSYYYNSTTGEVNVNSSGSSFITTSRQVYGQHYADFWNNHTTDSLGNHRSSSYINNESVAPYVCLKSYVENPSTLANNLQNPNGSVAGGQTAAQIIYSAGQTYGINPQVLLVTLQKEQGLVTDDWPWMNEYEIAMGYACPDGGSCNSTYYGFANQVSNAAKQFRRYFTNPTNYNYIPGNNTIRYNPNASCGSSNVAIQNEATAALYNYTPYQPNAAALANVSDTSSGGNGDSCSAYGNRNFWWYFNNWFGSTQTSVPYAWTIASSSAYTDSGRTQAYSNSPVIDIAPSGTAYVTLQARNNGYQTWSQSVVHLATSYPGDRSSSFANGTWLSPQRIQMQESSVQPGNTGTFSFSMSAPSQPGTYIEHFSLVADGITWMNDPDFYYTVNVTSPISATNTKNTGLTIGQSLSPGQWLMSPDSQTVLAFQSNGAVVEYSDFKPVWSNNVNNSGAQIVVLQSDGNLVEYDGSGHALWSTGTNGTTNHLSMQTDGNVVMYSGGGTPLWSTGTSSVPNHLNKADSSIPPNGIIYPGQFMQTANRAYTLVLQAGDGNLVEYDASGHPVWASGTNNPNVVGVMQSDGNFVIYGPGGKALWTTNTGGGGNSLTLQPSGVLMITNGNNAVSWNNHAVLQAGQYIQTADRAYTLVLQAADGNLVEYDSSGKAVWASGTNSPGDTLIMQGDGNMVIYSRSGRPVWATNTGGGGNVFALQNDGNMVIYGGNGRALWASR